MSYRYLEADHNGSVSTIKLNRPDVMNALNDEMQSELQAAFDAFAADPSQYICVITGAGKAFCAGTDLKAGKHASYPPSGYGGLVERHDCPKPFIAAVNGVALGGGFELALACDLIIASEAATFGLPEPLVGVVALAGGLHRLPRQIGLKQAMSIILTGRQVSAEEGLRVGFVNEVVRPTDLESAIRRLCNEILRCAPMAIRASKETVMRGLEEADIGTAIRRQAGYPAFAMLADSEDANEGMRAFAEKRPPRWRGR